MFGTEELSQPKPILTEVADVLERHQEIAWDICDRYITSPVMEVLLHGRKQLKGTVIYQMISNK